MIRTCPYTGLAMPDSVMSWEHPIPEAIGGGDALRIRVYERINTRFGTEVDGPFVNSEIMRYYRSKKGVRGKDGQVPWYEETVQAQVSVPLVDEVDGAQAPQRFVPIRVRSRTVNGKREGEPLPLDYVIKDPEGHWTYQIAGRFTEEEALSQLAAIQAKREARGRRGYPMPPQRGEWNVNLPEGHWLSVEQKVVGRFMAKAALGIASWLFGDGWSLTPHAAQLRSVVKGEIECWDAPLLRGQVGSLRELGPGVWHRMTPFRSDPEHEHEIGFVPYADGVRLHVAIFGLLVGFFVVAPPGAIPQVVGWGVRFRERGKLRLLAVDPAFRGARRNPRGPR